MSRPFAVAFLLLFLLDLSWSRAWGQPGQIKQQIGDPLPKGAILRIGTNLWRVGKVSSSVLSPDGRTVFAGTDDGIRVFDLDSGLLVRTLKGHDGEIRSLAVSLNGNILASAGYKTTLLWDVKSGKQIRPLNASRVSVMTFTPDSKKLITGGNDNDHSVRVFDLSSGKEQLRMLWHRSQVSFLGCADDKNLVSVCRYDNHICIADLETGDVVHTLQEKGVHDTMAALSPDGKTLGV